MLQIAFLIPITSKGRNWTNLNESYLMNYTLSSFFQTKNNEYKYKFYIGFDHDDPLYSQINTIAILKEIFNKIDIELNIIVYKDIRKGYLTKMWNILYEKAYNDNNDYFYQCGDDIHFQTQNWIKDSIEILQKNNDIGVSGPNNVQLNDTILTQAMVSKKHYQIFGYLFPPNIINWYCNFLIYINFYYSNFIGLERKQRR